MERSNLCLRILLTLGSSFQHPGFILFAVFDGHGGIPSLKFAAQNLHQNLIRKFPKGEAQSSVGGVHLGGWLFALLEGDITGFSEES